MNRYKQTALQIVQRWAWSGEYLVDRHVSLEMLASGFLATVIGEVGTGKTTLGHQVAKRLHKLGCRAPAFIDEVVFTRFIDVPRRVGEDYHRPDPFAHLLQLAHSTHTPVVVSMTTNRAVFQRPTLLPAHLNRLLTLGNHSLATMSDIIWWTFRKNGEFYAKLLKSRTTNVDLVGDIHVTPEPEYRIEDCPFFQRGLEMARLIGRNR